MAERKRAHRVRMEIPISRQMRSDIESRGVVGALAVGVG
jgi:hypothetical protein